MNRSIRLLAFASLLAITAGATAKPVHYTLDPSHTYPSFAADHMGLSLWRGKFDHSTGTLTLDKAAKTGSVHVVTQVASIDFGDKALNAEAVEPVLSPSICKAECNFFDAAKYPDAVYDGKLVDWVHDAPTRVVGTLTLHGVTRPLDLKIEHFKCKPDLFDKTRERCGAEASAEFNRANFGIDVGKSWNFNMKVALQIQVEAEQDK